MPLDLHSFLAEDAVDMGADNPEFAGVFIPKTQRGVVSAGVTSQFLENAEVYHQKYFATAYTDWLIGNTKKLIRVPATGASILDIGSGSGPSVFSLLTAFDDCNIVATDISPQLLSILQRMLALRGVQDRVVTCCLDLNKPIFRGQPFDLAIGKAILHHLFEPEILITQVFASIKPGGSLVFYEPFETGMAALAMVLRQILASPLAQTEMTQHMRAFLTRRIAVARVMRCEPKDPEKFADVDDKIAFTRVYFQRIADRLGAALQVYPVNNTRHPFRDSMRTTFRIALGKGEDILPDWAWKIIDDAERAVSEDFMMDCMMTGCVIFTKPGPFDKA
jgi:2-polyprenyl-3-methyl-5-hydroxy-6-metoxy-1,4-benzoquinol methylase